MVRKVIIFLLLLLIVFSGWNCFTVLNHVNQGESISHGTHVNGSIENAWLLDYSGPNYNYFSPVSYYFMANAFVHSRVYKTIQEAMATCEKTAPGIQYRVMECSNRKGGKMLFHYTHRNGLSVDFMSPKMKKGRQVHFWDRMGLSHYLLNFDPEGKLYLAKKVSIDFEALGSLLLALDEAAERNGLRIRSVIFRDYLQDNLLATSAGKLFEERGITFWQNNRKFVHKMHDDHFHVTFELI